tara:strand:+ start:325 stop:1335 length:1011 start_codon:yes stop_codon:yes gene_type:complete
MAYISFQPKDLFQTTLYTGNASARTITTGMQPDWVWTKARNAAHHHVSTDSVTGAGKRLRPSTNNAQDVSGASVASFVSTGYTLTDNDTVNGNTETNVSWSWKMGTTSGLSGGTITPSSYSINAAAGMGVYQTTGTGSAGTIAHGLGKAPEFIISKRMSHTGSWVVYHEAMGNANEMYLDATDGQSSASATWNSTTPTSTVWSVGNDQNNTSGYTIVSFAFAPIKGFSKFGSYTGSGGQNFIYTGFKPAWLLMKSLGAGTQWILIDNKRGYNGSNELLYPDSSEVAGSAEVVDLVSNGFVQRSAGGGNNQNAVNYVYMAFAEEPFVASNGNAATAR